MKALERGSVAMLKFMQFTTQLTDDKESVKFVQTLQPLDTAINIPP